MWPYESRREICNICPLGSFRTVTVRLTPYMQQRLYPTRSLRGSFQTPATPPSLSTIYATASGSPLRIIVAYYIGRRLLPLRAEPALARSLRCDLSSYVRSFTITILDILSGTRTLVTSKPLDPSGTAHHRLASSSDNASTRSNAAAVSII